MGSSNFVNLHDQLGVGDNAPTSKQENRAPGEFGNDTLDAPSKGEKSDQSRDHAYDSGVIGSSTIKHTGEEAKWDTVARTEIGDPNGRVPTARDIRQQLNVARDAELPPAVDASRVGPAPPRSGYGDVIPAGSGTVREHRNSNYAPGYEAAAAAVPTRSHEAADHKPSLLSHEPATPLTEVPPEIEG
ncbi:hypothetical protein VPNG_09142 [Cytospora leucostoma]|uniref:Uncharacterized protein n=1 Tax=Cytospora leucostoma TaxID=1230097 RepID=A0A423VYE5_9PEZI|nr:hypothetical protein VPNG_09142 [Cytospora leucostoma]